MSEEEKGPEKTAETSPVQVTAPEKPKKFNLQVKELTLKQAPMEAVIDRET